MHDWKRRSFGSQSNVHVLDFRAQYTGHIPCWQGKTDWSFTLHIIILFTWYTYISQPGVNKTRGFDLKQLPRAWKCVYIYCIYDSPTPFLQCFFYAVPGSCSQLSSSRGHGYAQSYKLKGILNLIHPTGSNPNDLEYINCIRTDAGMCFTSPTGEVWDDSVSPGIYIHIWVLIYSSYFITLSTLTSNIRF